MTSIELQSFPSASSFNKLTGLINLTCKIRSGLSMFLIKAIDKPDFNLCLGTICLYFLCTIYIDF